MCECLDSDNKYILLTFLIDNKVYITEKVTLKVLDMYENGGLIILLLYKIAEDPRCSSDEMCFVISKKLDLDYENLAEKRKTFVVPCEKVIVCSGWTKLQTKRFPRPYIWYDIYKSYPNPSNQVICSVLSSKFGKYFG